MAEAALTFFLEKCSEWLAPKMLQWLNRDEFDEKVRILQKKMDWARACVRDMDGKCMGNERAKVWMSELRDIAYNAENSIVDFIQIARQTKKPKPWNPLQNPLYNAAKKIDEIIADLSQTIANKSDLGIGSVSVSDASISLRSEKIPPIVEEEDVVGFDEAASQLAAQLIGGREQRFVVSIVGMGGLGKTTLAKKVYNRSDVKENFDCHLWIHLSQEFKLKEVLQEMIRSIELVTKQELNTMFNKMSVRELSKEVHGLLEKKRYLVVLDDIWQEKAWNGLAAALPKGTTRSRVLITSRNVNVALHADARGLHELRHLGEAESWSLFCKKSFPRDNSHSCPVALEEVGREMLAKCKGLPLAIVVLGGILSMKMNTRNEWVKVLLSINWQLQNGEEISKILGLSYSDLPPHLQDFFLYFGAYREDHDIRTSELIKMWTAERFVNQRGKESLEDVAEDCLNELVTRSMIQVTARNSCGGIKSCRIHPLLRNLSISKAKEDAFLEVYDNLEPISPTKAHRLAIIHHDLGKCISLNRRTTQLRSLLCFPPKTQSLESDHLESICGGFKYLRILKLHEVSLPSKSVDVIGSLIHLKYLALWNTCLERLPSTLSNLENLETLDVNDKCITNVPDYIWKLEKLRHLHIKGNIPPQGYTISSDVRLGYLSNLQTLTNVRAGKWIEDGLEKLTNLTKLGINGDLSRYEDIFVKLSLTSLKSLKLFSPGISSSVLQSFSHCRNLHSMSLDGQLDSLVDRDLFPQSLTKLTLAYSSMEQNLLKTLEMLPSLRVLRLWNNSYVEREMVCAAQGFPQLQVLTLEEIDELEEWTVEEEAMPNLRCLKIKSCGNLHMLPEGLKYMTSLEELIMEDISGNLKSRLQRNEGEDWYKIKHIPSITIKEQPGMEMPQ